MVLINKNIQRGVIVINFKYYVLNFNYNDQKVENYNIFNNLIVNRRTEQIVKKYLRAPSKFKYQSFASDKAIYGFEGFCQELNSIIAGEERGRFEYEIAVGYLLENDHEKYEKWDCWMQCKPNIEIIAREVIYQYKEYLKSQRRIKK